MGFIRSLLERFKRQESEASVEKSALSQVDESCEYDDALIGMLENDHAQLFKLYHNIQDQFNDDNEFHKVRPLLHDFKLALEIHLMVENSKLYRYIRDKNRDNTQVIEFVNTSESEMRLLGDEIFQFFDKYMTQDEYIQSIEQFLSDLSQIGTKLIRRIVVEESKLYTLYQKHY
jgi:hypothetical protein